MTVIGIDDTDSRTAGMCTTHAASQVATRARETGAAVERLLLVRLNPAVEHKTRGNAALAVHADLDPETAFAIAREVIDATAATDDPATNPGLVVAPGDPGTTDDPEGIGDGSTGGDERPDDASPSESIAAFARAAIRDHLDRATARDLLADRGYRHAGWGNERGLIGALAAVGAWTAFERRADDESTVDAGRTGGFDGWTHEHIAYREPERWGTPRNVDRESVFAAAATEYPTVWDTVDRVEGEAVCVPHTPGPVLYGVRGDDPAACETVAARVESEPVARAETFLTNQGTDAHLRAGSIGALRDGRAYRVDGVVAAPPETREGGHVFVVLEGDDARLQCVAFEPTKRFRDRVRALRVGDRLTACGEFAEGGPAVSGGADAETEAAGENEPTVTGTLKLEKFAVRDLVATERVTPTCPDCDRRMESAGRDQGYRCRDCGTARDRKTERRIEREIEAGWYEVPPCARRHIAKPLVRGGFDAPTHPER